MTNEPWFRITLIVMYTGFTIIRVHYHRLALKSGGAYVARRPGDLLLPGLIALEVVVFFAYLFSPGTFARADLGLPVWLRWTGALIGMAALPLFAWVHRNLGANFSVSLRVSDVQTLVTTGPYRWVRHPMYTAFCALHIGVFLLTANWLIGAVWLGGLAFVVASRVRREEAMLVERFGQQYLSYMRRTGRFLPRVHLGVGAQELGRRLLSYAHSRAVGRHDDPV